MTHKPLKAMTVSAKETHRAILKLISVLSGPAYLQSDQNKPLNLQIELCMERIKAEASEGVALIDACAPHGRAMLSQAQQKLDALAELSVLHQLAMERFDIN
ncbi:hypothetical protein MITS9508_01313 [Synechococcus sp. MIT S9508]|nr:hypothetical protein MITS9508_01313 [Synechococcus sp. MIT S9508]